MKLLAALLIFVIAAQPVQAGFCDMEQSGDSDPHASMQHDMGANSPGNADSPGHDCCQTPAADNEEPCSDMPCGSCITGVQAIPLTAQLSVALPAASHVFPGEGRISPSHTSPPFRPPISIS